MTKQFQLVQSAKTIASFIKKNKHLFKQSSNSLAQFLYDELSKCNSNKYTYHLDNAKIEFSIVHYDGNYRKGGYLLCCIWDLDNQEDNIVFSSDIASATYYYKSRMYYNFSLFDNVISANGVEEERKVLFEWDKIIKCMESYF